MNSTTQRDFSLGHGRNTIANLASKKDPVFQRAKLNKFESMLTQRYQSGIHHRYRVSAPNTRQKYYMGENRAQQCDTIKVTSGESQLNVQGVIKPRRTML